MTELFDLMTRSVRELFLKRLLRHLRLGPDCVRPSRRLHICSENILVPLIMLLDRGQGFRIQIEDPDVHQIVAEISFDNVLHLEVIAETNK